MKSCTISDEINKRSITSWAYSNRAENQCSETGESQNLWRMRRSYSLVDSSYTSSRETGDRAPRSLVVCLLWWYNRTTWLYTSLLVVLPALLMSTSAATCVIIIIIIIIIITFIVIMIIIITIIIIISVNFILFNVAATL